MNESIAQVKQDLSNGTEKLFKTIIKSDSQQHSLLTPQPGCKVTVHYTGKIKSTGVQFDSSIDRGVPFSFCLGQGDVIKGWDVAIATMHKNEECVLEIDSEWAYGFKGAGKDIPPNADLIFHVQLMGWTYPDVSQKQDMSMIKQIVKSGDGWEKAAEERMAVTANVGVYASRQTRVVPNDTFTVSVDENSSSDSPMELIEPTSELRFIYGDEMIHPTLERVISDMKRGEKSLFFIHKNSSELEGVSDVEKRYWMHSERVKSALEEVRNGTIETLCFEIELIDFVRPPPIWNMGFSDKVALCNTLKHEGNQYFATRRFNMALKRYNQLVDAVESSEHKLTEDQKRELEINFKAVAFSNAAAALLQTKEYNHAVDMCTKALDCESKALDVKVYYRRATAYNALGEHEKAIQDLERAVAIDPQNIQLQQELERTNQLIKQQREKERAVYRRMFD